MIQILRKTSAPRPDLVILQTATFRIKKVEMITSGVILEEKEAEQLECKSDLVKLERSGACILRTRKG